MLHQAAPACSLTVRKLDVDLSHGFGRRWLGGDAYRTQLFNALSMTFPIGEQMFIDSEATHRHVHVQYNAPIDDAEPQLRRLWEWHAVEELEHKAVAFDAYRAGGGGYWRRVLWFGYVSLVFWFDDSIQTAHNLRRDGALWRPGSWLSAARMWFGRRGLAWHMAGPVPHYFSPRFHPWQHDNRSLVQMWLDRNKEAWRAVRPTASRPAPGLTRGRPGAAVS